MKSRISRWPQIWVRAYRSLFNSMQFDPRRQDHLLISSRGWWTIVLVVLAMMSCFQVWNRKLNLNLKSSLQLQSQLMSWSTCDIRSIFNHGANICERSLLTALEHCQLCQNKIHRTNGKRYDNSRKFSLNWVVLLHMVTLMLTSLWNVTQSDGKLKLKQGDWKLSIANMSFLRCVINSKVSKVNEKALLKIMIAGGNQSIHYQQYHATVHNQVKAFIM